MEYYILNLYEIQCVVKLILGHLFNISLTGLRFPTRKVKLEKTFDDISFSNQMCEFMMNID
jgi:hypothetical protein